MQSNSSSDPKSEHSLPRRSCRLYVKIRVRIEWHLEGKTLLSEDTETCVLNAHGALVMLGSAPPLGQKATLQNASTHEIQEVIVVFVSKEVAKDGKFYVGVEFTNTNGSFWHVSFPPEDWSLRHPDAKT